jgi:hypothetical protein
METIQQARERHQLIREQRAEAAGITVERGENIEETGQAIEKEMRSMMVASCSLTQEIIVFALHESNGDRTCGA